MVTISAATNGEAKQKATSQAVVIGVAEVREVGKSRYTRSCKLDKSSVEITMPSADKNDTLALDRKVKA